MEFHSSRWPQPSRSPRRQSKALKEPEEEATKRPVIPKTSAEKSTAVVIQKSINASEQLLKINKNANELLDLLMAWQRGDEVALSAFGQNDPSESRPIPGKAILERSSSL